MSWQEEPPRHELSEEGKRDAEADLLAMLAASRELGPDMDRALTESYLTRHDEPPAPVPLKYQDAPVQPVPEDGERSFAPWLIPAIFLFSLLLFAAPFHFGGFFPVFLLVLFLARGRSRDRRISGEETVYTPLSHGTAPDPALAPPQMPITIAHPGARFDVVLMHPGVNKIAAIKEVRMLTGTGLREAKQLTDFAPRTVLHDVSADRANIALAQLSAVGAHVAIQSTAEPMLPPPPAQRPTVSPPPPYPQQWPASTGTDGPAAPPANPAG